MNRYEEAEQLAQQFANYGNEKAKSDLPRIRKLIDDGEICWSANCDGPCGWDGESDRCNCGNRRVYWEWQDKEAVFVPQEY